MNTNIDLRDENNLYIETSGGEYEHNCEDCGDCKISEYTLTFGDLNITLTPEQAVILCRRLKEHLENNGREI